MMRKVVMESPYAGDTEANVAYARSCLADCLARNEAPLASHLLYTQVLDDSVHHDRALGISAGTFWIPRADALVVYQDHGISFGMRAAIRTAELHKIPVEYRTLEAQP